MIRAGKYNAGLECGWRSIGLFKEFKLRRFQDGFALGVFMFWRNK